MLAPEFGYMRKICRVDLTSKQVMYEFPEASVVRDYIGGTGLGIYYLYKEVPPQVKWSDPQNRFVLMSGPLGGTFGPTGTYSIVTKGPMTNGASSTQANGNLGAFLRFSGLDGLIIQGASQDPVYLYIHNDKVEIREAQHLIGKDTWETQESIERELQKSEKELSVLSIGIAGENLVRFASTVSDRGHVASHNGVGAVLGSKKLKAIAVEKGDFKVALHNRDAVRTKVKWIIENITKKGALEVHNWGTSKGVNMFNPMGLLPIKNYTTQEGGEYYKLDGTYYRERFDMKKTPCWGCGFKHNHRTKIKDGPYKGHVGEEQEYEGMVAMGSLIGQTDPAAATVLGNLIDKIGVDTNEAGWLVAWLMECFEKGVLSAKDLDGIELTWGNAAAVEKILDNIASRRGFGDILAEGVMRAAMHIGGAAQEMAIYTRKGNVPRSHDHRSAWNHILDTAVSSMGTDEIAMILNSPASLGLPSDTDRNTPEGAAAIVATAAGQGIKLLYDSLPMCSLGVNGASRADLAELLAAATGWDYTSEEAGKFGLRVHNLLRSFGIRSGHTKEMDEPSLRYSSASLKGMAVGKDLHSVWGETRDNYYRNMGWDVETGKPLPSTLREVGLEYVIPDLWGQE